MQLSAKEFKIRDPSIRQGSCLWDRQDVKLSGKYRGCRGAR
jgi:hypothetical protein